MENEQGFDVEVAQLEIVRRYAIELRESASQGRRVEQNGRRCYELLNECAMELAELTRLKGAEDDSLQ